MDDLGYADIGPFGGDTSLTPNLNRMAEDGRKFTDFYVSQAVCSASRTSLLTGCYNVRAGIEGALGPAATIGINADEVTLGELCQQKNYATACFGKWHLGHHEQFFPLQNGFDEYFGLPYSNDMWPYHPEVLHLPMEERLMHWPQRPLIDGNTTVNPQMTGDDQKLLTTQYTERAVSFIDRNADKPFCQNSAKANSVAADNAKSDDFEQRSRHLCRVSRLSLRESCPCAAFAERLRKNQKAGFLTWV